MNEQEQDTRTLTIEEASKMIREILRQTARDSRRTRIEENGNIVAAIVPASDLEQLEQDDRQRREGFAAMARISEAFIDVPIEELEKEVNRAVRDARKRIRKRGSLKHHTGS